MKLKNIFLIVGGIILFVILGNFIARITNDALRVLAVFGLALLGTLLISGNTE